MNRLIDVAAEPHLEHVVFSSVEGADTNPVVPHHRVETHPRASGLPWTMLRPGFFAQNLTDAYRLDIKDDHRLYVPAAHGRVAFIDVTDLGEVAATVFADPTTHPSRGDTITGPEALTFDDVAALLTQALDKPVHYQPATITGYLRHLHQRGLPPAHIAVQTILHVGLRRGTPRRSHPLSSRSSTAPPPLSPISSTPTSTGGDERVAGLLAGAEAVDQPFNDCSTKHPGRRRAARTPAIADTSVCLELEGLHCLRRVPVIGRGPGLRGGSWGGE